MINISRNLISLSKSCLLMFGDSNSRLIFRPLSRKSKYVFRVVNTVQKRSFSILSESNINLENPDVQKYISTLVEEYKSLKTNDNNVTQDIRERINELSPVIMLINERRSLVADSAELKSMKEENSADNELKVMVLEEINTFHQKIKKIDEQILSNLVPKDPQENNGALLEVSAGVGGKEAMLFSRELFDMYCNYASFRGWDVEIALMDVTEIGGLRHSSALISGKGPVYGLLSHEAGVHRVQRIPVTERSGRVHTSTVRVVVLPQPTELEIDIKKDDLKIETKRASGAGGQHVNTTDSAVRITHIPSGISVDCQTDRSQYRNKELALQRLRTKLYEAEKKKRDMSDSAARKEQIGEAARSEKIRTYNFNQDRITDHRISCTMHNLESFFQGKESLDSLICNLYRKGKEERLIQVLKTTR